MARINREEHLTLPDVLGPGLRVLFVGFNPSVRAAELGHHYAGRGNGFWRLLAGARLTPRLLSPTDDRSVSQWGIGLTNLSSRPTPSVAELNPAELRAGVPRLRALVLELVPAVVAYTGKGVYLAAARVTRAPWGLQVEPLFGAARDFVLPSPSGLVRMSFAEKLEHYRALSQLLEGGTSL